MLRIDRVLLFSVLAVLLCPSVSFATTRYVSQSGGLYSGPPGTACIGKTAISVATFNALTQSAGDINYLCGTITSALAPLGSGNAGSPILIIADTGAVLTFAAIPTNGAINLNGLQYYTLDGGGGNCGFVNYANVTCGNGQILSTANGSGLANQIASIAIYLNGASNITVKGWQIGPVYLHTSTSDNTQSPPGPVCVYYVGGSEITIVNNTMHDAAWCVNGSGSAILVENNEIYDVDHGIGTGGTGSAYVFDQNHIHDFVNWDTTMNSLHHDGIHIFGTTSLPVNGATESNNLIDGDPGANWTADIFNEGQDSNFVMFNNVAIVPATRVSCCGVIGFDGSVMYPGSNNSAWNNTVYGAYVTGTGSCFGVSAETNVVVEDNVFVNCENIITVDSASTIGTVDYNTYEDVGTTQGIDGSANTFVWHGSFFSSFTTWKSDCSCDAHSVFNTLANINVNSTSGKLQAGSVAIGAAANLGFIGTGLQTDILKKMRPASGNWDPGAFVFTLPPPIPTSLQPIILGSLPNGNVGLPYVGVLSAANDTLPNVWTVNPSVSGISLNPSTGVLSGTPTVAGTTKLTFGLTDSFPCGTTSGCTDIASPYSTTLTIGPPLASILGTCFPLGKDVGCVFTPSFLSGKAYAVTMSSSGVNAAFIGTVP